ncbi:MAG: hypothetical protein ACYCYP_01320 [Leptospirales bacterium]
MEHSDQTFRKGEDRRIRVFGLWISLFLWMVSAQGCALLHPEPQASLSDRNRVRFQHAMRQVQADLKDGRLDDASRLVEIWKKYQKDKGFPEDDQVVLKNMSGQVDGATALYLAGQASQLERLGKFREARDLVQKARKLEPGWDSLGKMDRHLQIQIAVRSEMGHNWKDLIRRLMALKIQYSSSHKLDQTLSWAWSNLAESQYEVDDFSSARDSLLQAKSYDPDNPQAQKIAGAMARKLDGWIDQGERMFRSNDLSGSLLIFRKVLLVDPTSARALRDESLVREALAQLGASPSRGGR